MIFVDTNYFLRFLLSDIDEQNQLSDIDEQNQQAKKLFQSAALGKITLFTSLIVFFEVYWVLTSFYKKDKKEVARALKGVLEMSFIKIEERNLLPEVIGLFEKSDLGLEDTFNLAFAKKEKASSFKTFDIKLDKAFAKANKKALSTHTPGVLTPLGCE